MGAVENGQSLLARADFVRRVANRRAELPQILCVSADLRLYSGVLHAACCNNLRAHWVRSLSRAIEICAEAAILVAVFDMQLPFVEWTTALDLLSRTNSRPRVLLASAHVDEDLWRSVLEHRGYDVIHRNSNSEAMGLALKFACLSLAAA